MGTACYVRGAKAVLESIERHLGIDVQVEETGCMETCAGGPMVALIPTEVCMPG